MTTRCPFASLNVLDSKLTASESDSVHATRHVCDKEFIVFWTKERPTTLKQAIAIATAYGGASGTSRRATSLVPFPTNEASHEIAHTSSLRFHQLLITLEGNQRTGVLKIFSPRRRSRSAVLIFRGRVVGSLYGRKNIDYHMLDREAHKYAMRDLASAGNILDAYQLPEDLVLASAALFYGQTLPIPTQMSAEHMLQHAVSQIIETSLPGVVVVNNLRDELVCMVYVSSGRVIGVFSTVSGWIKPTFDAAAQLLKEAQVPRVMCSVLTQASQERFNTFGFSLTGLADERKQWIMPSVQAVDALTLPSLQLSVQERAIGTGSHRYQRESHARATSRHRQYTIPTPAQTGSNAPKGVVVANTRKPTFAIIP